MNPFHWFKKKPHTLGLALSGGSTRGAAHIGVLQVLEREGIRPQVIAGTSTGAIIGAAYAAGVPVDQISHMFLETSWPNLLSIAWSNRLSLFDTEPLAAFIRANIGDISFEELPRPFACVACDLLTGERVVFDHGPVAEAVRASAAVPGLFSPVMQNGRMLVDGGLLDNLPVEQARLMGADYVIAIDVTAAAVMNHPPKDMLEVLMAASNLVQNRAAVPELNRIDCYIRPDVEEFSAWSFDQSVEMEARGRAAAEGVIVQLKADLKRLAIKG